MKVLTPKKIEIMRLLKSLTFDESHMKVNRKMTTKEEESTYTNNQKKKSSSVGQWFNNSKPRYVYGQQQPSDENDVFGGYLRMDGDEVPHIVSLCITEVEARGLESLGIYRLSGPASTIQKYRASFNNSKSVYVCFSVI